PVERLKAFVAEGWQPTFLPDSTLLDELRPEAIRIVQRAQVSLFGMRYYAPDLIHWHGKKVRIRYDLRDGSKVWIRALDGRVITEAKRDANVHPYLHDTVLERATAKRAAAKVRLLEQKIAAIEADEKRTIAAAPVELSAEQHAAAERQLELMDDGVQVVTAGEIEPVAVVEGIRPIFRGPMAERDWGVWVWEHWDTVLVDDEDRADFEAKMESQDFRLLIGFDGKSRLERKKQRAG
ncbi:MAG: Mu transposase C-terminal domain-containing protein, partial [Magnetococcales bacterium]|nr:Mu transposase C-terminal domain-containing protein [Magnetococcales bacterium]